MAKQCQDVLAQTKKLSLTAFEVGGLTHHLNLMSGSSKASKNCWSPFPCFNSDDEIS